MTRGSGVRMASPVLPPSLTGHAPVVPAAHGTRQAGPPRGPRKEAPGTTPRHAAPKFAVIPCVVFAGHASRSPGRQKQRRVQRRPFICLSSRMHERPSHLQELRRHATRSRAAAIGIQRALARKLAGVGARDHVTDLEHQASDALMKLAFAAESLYLREIERTNSAVLARTRPRRRPPDATDFLPLSFDR